MSSVSWAVTGSGASPADADDFGGTFPSGTIAFLAAETEQMITVNVSGDIDVEDDETFTVTLSNPVGATITTATATGTITADDVSRLTLDLTAGLPAGFTCERASDQWLRDANGYQTKVAADTYAVHHTHDGTPLGYLSEGEFTAAVGYTNDLGDWSRAALIPDATRVTGPDNTDSAWRCLETAQTTSHAINAPETHARPADSLTYITTAFARAGLGREWVRLGAPAHWNQFFDVTNGAVGTTKNGTPETPLIKAEANSFYRVSFARTAALAANVAPYLSVWPTDAATNYLGDVTKGMDFWGVNYGVGKYPTSYVEVVGSGTGTRAAGRLSGSFDGRILTSIRVQGRTAQGVGATDQHFASVGTSAGGNLVRVYRDVSDRHILVDWETASGWSDPVDIGAVADDTDFDTGVVPLVGAGWCNWLEIGADVNGANHCDGTVKSVEIV